MTNRPITAHTGSIGDFFEDAFDAVTSDTFFTILGTVLTAGSYGYASGLLNLTGAQKIVLEEGMKAIAGGVAMTAQRFAACKAANGVNCTLEPPGFLDAWQGQVAYRTKQMIAVGGPAFAASVASTLATYIAPASLTVLQQTWDLAKQGERYARDPVGASREHLDRLQKECQSQFTGPINPAMRDACRKDSLAQATNLASGGTVYDTTDWDAATGEPPPLPTTNLTVQQAIDQWLVVLRTKAPYEPEAQAAADIIAAARRNAVQAEAQAEKARRSKAERDVAAGYAREELARACQAGVPDTCAIATKIAQIPTATPPTAPRTFLQNTLALSAIGAPALLPLLLLAIWRSRRGHVSPASSSRGPSKPLLRGGNVVPLALAAGVVALLFSQRR